MKKYRCLVATCLMFIVAFFNNIEVAFADEVVNIYDVDDYRELVGKARVNSDEFICYMEDIIKENKIYTDYELWNEKLVGISVNKTYSDEYGDTLNKILEMEEEIVSYIGNGSSANLILETVNKAEALKNSLGKMNKHTVELDYEDVFRAQQTEEIEKIVESYIDELNNGSYSIGALAKDSKSYMGGKWYITNVFGAFSNMGSEGKEEVSYLEQQNNWEYELEVLSVFNGEVIDIQEEVIGTGNENEDTEDIKEETEDVTEEAESVEKESRFSVTIAHGDKMTTTLTGLSNVKVTVGKTVNQNDALGELKTGDYSRLYIKLDGLFVDPLLGYGIEGKRAYYDFKVRNPWVIGGTDVESIKLEAKYKEQKEEYGDNYEECLLDDSNW